MGVMEDTIGEFRKAKPGEKALIIAGSLAVLGVALYLHSKSNAAQPYQAATPASSGTGTGSSSSGWGTVGPNQTPILPGGYNPIYDPNGNLVGYGPTPTPTPTPTPPPPSSNLCPPGVFCTSYGHGSSGKIVKTPTGGPLWAGPSGVMHYTVQRGDTLRSISRTYVPGGTWNSIYAIPDNQKLFGKLSPQQAANYAPKPGTTITLPSNAALPQGGGPFGTRVLGQHGKRVAPTVEGQTHVARVYKHQHATRGVSR